MKRREFITSLGAAAWTLVARADEAAIPVVGFLHFSIARPYTSLVAEFRQGLSEAGYVEGQNVMVEYRWANNQAEHLRELADDLIRRQVAVIVAAGGTRSALAAKAATSTIPIVLAVGVDPVALGLVASLNRPGGNVTGVTFITADIEAKRLELLTQMVPQAMTVAYLNVDPQTSMTVQRQVSSVYAAALALGREIVFLQVDTDRDIERAFPTIVQRRAGALLVGTSPIFTSNRDKLLAQAASHQLPAMYHIREFVADGGLMSYGANLGDTFRRAGAYVGSILKGAKPANLPVEQSTRFELVINLKTATALGLTVPRILVARADEIIE